VYKNIFYLIHVNKFQKEFFIFSILMLIGIVFETLGLAIIFPVLEIMSSPDKIFKYKLLKDLLISDQLYAVVNLLPILIIMFYVIKSIYLVFLYWKQSEFSANLGEKISINLFATYLFRPYSFHLKINSSELHRNIKTETLQFTEVIKSLLNIFLESLVLISIIIILMYVEPFASFSMLTFGVLLSLIYSKFTSIKLEKWGQVRQGVSTETSKTIFHAFGGIKDVKILELEQFYLKKYKKYNDLDVGIQKKMSTISFLPRLFLEFIAVSGLMLFILIVKLRGGSIQLLIPVLGIFLASAFRTIPSINRIISSIQYINFSKPVIQLLKNEFLNFNLKSYSESNVNINEDFRQLIIEDLKFSYEKNSKIVLNNINLTINKGDIIGIIGESGAGKSTFVDLILGINQPNFGKLIFNGKNIFLPETKWNRQLGYIQQNVFLLDDTLVANIALGIDPEEVDYQKLNKAIEQSQLTSFVNDLPNGLNSNVGERGLRISGGQRQRIGIARALYRNPNFLVFDEATSNLDVQTEAAIMGSIKLLSLTKTIIIIAHRKSALLFCNKIFKIQNANLILESIN
jgi:ABC-type multidrug transport system fused ATPase/permease subunit